MSAHDASQSSPADLEAANLLLSLSLDHESSSHEISEPTNTLPASHVGTDNAAYGQGQSHEESIAYSTLQQGVEPAAYYQQGVVPAAYYQQGVVPAAHYQQGVVPAAYYQQGVVPAAHYQQGVVPAAYYQQGLVPATYYQQGVVPAAYYQQGVVPAAYYQQGVVPAAYYQQGVEPATHYQHNSYPPQGYYFPGNVGSTQYDGHVFHPGVYGVNAPVMYHQVYPYPSYPTYRPDGMLYMPQQHQYPPHYFQTSYPVMPSQAVFSNSATPEQNLSFVENASRPININAGGGAGNNVAAAVQSFHPNSLGNNEQRYAIDASRTPVPQSNGPQHSDAQPQALTNTTTISSMNQSAHAQSHLRGMYQPTTMSGAGPAQGYVNMIHPNQMYGQDGNRGTSGYGYDSNSYNARAYGRGYHVDDSFKSMGPGNATENISVSNELTWGQALPSNENEIPRREQYNLADFPVDYTDAKFFIIKSYSVENVYRSIKKNIWGSTTGGNKTLDKAYRESQPRSGRRPIFLFFSVSGSGKFVGVAEMTSRVDFDKKFDNWQIKWNGCFSVKWHILKDVWNRALKHIILEENENKPVTFSRDTQEVKLEKGLQMLKVFKECSSIKSILDDFKLYDIQETILPHKRARQQLTWKQKSIDKKNNEGTSQVRSDVSAELNKESTGDGEVVVEALEKKSDAKEVTDRR